MKLNKALALKFLDLYRGEQIPASKLKHPLVAELLAEGILSDKRAGRTKSVLYLSRPESLQAFLRNRFSIADLEDYVHALDAEEQSRSLLVQAAADSKATKVRTFKGFLVNSYEPVRATINETSLVIDPPAGTFQFIHAFEHFVPHPDVTIVGMENAENFSQVHRQAHLFSGMRPLFVSRYPQQQGKDLIRWLQGIPNPYVHFGDLDFAGIGIYLHEYKRHLGARATWFVPDAVESMLLRCGNRNLYDIQKINFDAGQIEEPAILEMIKLMHRYKRGLEQEAWISGDQAE
jgi:hypothetical protein